MKASKLFAVALLVGATVAAAASPFVTLDRIGAAKLVDPGSHAKPTIVTLWSVDCAYCKKNLKLFADMAKTEPRLKLITIAVEPVGEGLAEPLDRLAVPGVRFAYGDDAPEALAYAIDPKWRGELPRTMLFDGRGGKQVLSGVVGEGDARRALGLAPR
jgi:hypothetical protein